MEFFNWIMENPSDAIERALAILGGCAVLATFTPTKKDDSVIAKVTGIVHLLAMNFGKAKNK